MKANFPVVPIAAAHCMPKRDVLSVPTNFAVTANVRKKGN
jgi:hypothetical protein